LGCSAARAHINSPLFQNSGVLFGSVQFSNISTSGDGALAAERNEEVSSIACLLEVENLLL